MSRFDQAHRQVAANPAPIEEQIKTLVSVLERRGNWLQKQIDQNRIHPTVAAVELHRLRSTLITLQRVRDGELHP